jgi:hypothetical protein
LMPEHLSPVSRAALPASFIQKISSSKWSVKKSLFRADAAG